MRPARNLSVKVLAVISGLNFNLTETFVANAKSESKAFSSFLSVGFMWKKKDFESALGVFHYNYTELQKSEDSLRNPSAMEESKLFYMGLMMSGLYRF